jgi:hypothetical protein
MNEKSAFSRKTEADAFYGFVRHISVSDFPI